MEALPPISLYVHFPWCARKCPYCDFNSHPLHGALPEGPYLQALIRDFQAQKEDLAGRRLSSIFFGGGTPSLFSPQIFHTLIETLRPYFLSDNIEITMEANPGSFHEKQEPLSLYKDAGINRLSFGVQSFDNRHLKKLGRIHDAQEAQSAIVQAQEAGFENINIDLMYGLPDQSVSECLQDLHTAAHLQPQHLSWYQLSLEPNTWFYRYPPALPEEEHIMQMMEQGQAYLGSQGWAAYEISAYARAQAARCAHNQHYWLFDDYLGIGAGAHGKISIPAHDQAPFSIQRRLRPMHPKHYMSDPLVCVPTESLSAATLVFECLLNILRLYQDISWTHIAHRLGSAAAFLYTPAFQAFLDQAIAQGFFTSESAWPLHRQAIPSGRLQATAQTRLFLNSVLELYHEYCL